jgi:hypothetical protein
MTKAAEHTARLLRWYPRAWRVRYGDEFTELLAAELAERPRSARRTADVIASGLRARFADAGLSGHALDQPAAARAGLATLACCGAAFAVGGGAMWAQVAIGVQWATPRHHGVTQALDLMSLALLVFAAVGLLAIVGVARAAVAALRRGNGRTMFGPAGLVLAGTGVLFFGARHFQNGWPGTGGHLLVHQGLIPAGLAAFCWAATMWITSYLGHPAALATFPATQLAWMGLSAIASAAVVAGLARFLRRTDRSPAELRYGTWLGLAASAGMLLFIAGAVRWLISPGGGVPAFHVGSVDLAAMTLLVLALLVNGQALRSTAAARLAMAATGDR